MSACPSCRIVAIAAHETQAGWLLVAVWRCHDRANHKFTGATMEWRVIVGRVAQELKVEV